MDRTGYGLLQVSTARLRARKLFSWGNGDASDRWQEFLTDQAGRYVEIQAGIGKTQYGCVPMAPHTAWEWMEQYGPVKISPETLSLGHPERTACFAEEQDILSVWENMEKKLAETKPMARNRAAVVFPGSGYGALKKQGKLSEHLEFTVKEESLEKWRTFFETSKLHCPPPSLRPDEFLIDGDNLDFYLIRALYHLGKDKEAYELLEQNGGLEMEDIREGEDSLAQLWSGLYQNLYGEKKEIPHKYNFKAY